MARQCTLKSEVTGPRSGDGSMFSSEPSLTTPAECGNISRITVLPRAPMARSTLWICRSLRLCTNLENASMLTISRMPTNSVENNGTVPEPSRSVQLSAARE